MATDFILARLFHTLSLEVVQVTCLDGVGTIINLGKVNTVLFMYTATLSLEQ